jgi:hypothetical protein
MRSKRRDWSGATRALLRVALGAALGLLAMAAFAGSALAKPPPHVWIVSQATPPTEVPKNTTYVSTIQAAVNDTHSGDWVLVEPGTYDEEVLVSRPHHNIHIRGLNRNTVILDGQHKPAPNGSNGIFVDKVDNVWIENLTVRNFERTTSDGANGNEIWWTGGDESKHQGAHGWWGKYLTAYVTGLNGGYGIFTNNEQEGAWEDIYSSGFNDSGIYIGACWECKARVTKATIEDNATGYSGSNSGGSLVIEKSIFRNNSSGIVPNGENPGDGPPPNNGECNPSNTRPKSPYLTISSTNIERCEVFKENLVTENNNLEAPANPSTEIAPWGVGIELPGDAADLVEDNTITNNVNNGLLGFEYPNPYPPVKCTKEEREHGCTNTIYFQLTGVKVANNKFENNGTSGKSYASELMLQGGIFPYKGHESVNNCVSNNTYSGSAPETFPADIEEEWGCQHETTPPPNNGVEGILYVSQLSEESASDLRKIKAGVEPPPQESMPNPCEGVPTTTVCKGGEPEEGY